MGSVTFECGQFLPLSLLLLFPHQAPDREKSNTVIQSEHLLCIALRSWVGDSNVESAPPLQFSTLRMSAAMDVFILRGHAATFQGHVVIFAVSSL